MTLSAWMGTMARVSWWGTACTAYVLLALVVLNVQLLTTQVTFCVSLSFAVVLLFSFPPRINLGSLPSGAWCTWPSRSSHTPLRR